METTPKVHRHRHRRMESRHRRNERQVSNNTEGKSPVRPSENVREAEEGACTSTTASSMPGGADALIAAVATRLLQEHERQNHTEDGSSASVGVSSDGRDLSQTTQQTVVLVNGHTPQENVPENSSGLPYIKNDNNEPTKSNDGDGSELAATGPPDGPSSSRNSSGDAMSLRETLQQLPPTITAHRHRRTLSPHSPSRRVLETAADASFHRGILGFMDRELKQSSPTPSALSAGSGNGPLSGGGGGGGSGGGSRKHQSLSDPTASPAQHSIRSRSSLEKSPRRKRSKSESRRRRERKLIAAGEMEVRQANETLMRYLKQCSEMNDASLSGELEIDQSLEERRVHRKTKSQRDKRGHIISKLYSAGGLSSILKELSDDIVPAEGEEIYNPFTPVVSPTDDTPAHIDKIFMQTSSGYRPVEHCFYKHHHHSFMRSGGMSGRVSGSSAAAGSSTSQGAADSGNDGCGGLAVDGVGSGGGGNYAGFVLRPSASYGDTRCLLDGEYCRHEAKTNIELACIAQRIWLLIANICHGLLAGLALAHLLFVLTSDPTDWSKVLSLAGETFNERQKQEQPQQTSITIESSMNSNENLEMAALAVKADYATFANIYINTFYCLAIICMVSVLDRMDVCRWSLANASELISFRWLIIAMIYVATIILTICSDSIDEKLYLNNNNANVTISREEIINNSILSVWSSLSTARSIGAICGWIMIGLTPHEDLLYDHLVDLTRYQVTNN
ncbi:uncharacterized protein LOC119645084 [Glossina fuscipes]|uniref:Uncharacterized protein LOC119645084 n=1 Tax=Glossina fuscipes TaxID=7396 RepID=A0A9C6E4F4_9MUSC|nr:uncharacterized protein LOC119645084 [Glossina fuscipes]KAI9587523.1 hypothetical protein GQX74_003369 [Glossina fuscipes]